MNKLNRRRFIRNASLTVAAGIAPWPESVEAADDVLLRFGMITDLHYADADTMGSRHYRDSLAKLKEFVDEMNARDDIDFVIQGGDLKDQANPPEEASTLRYLAEIAGVYKQFDGPRFHVLGNHDMDSISKAQMLAGIGLEKSYYSTTVKGFDITVLDANFTSEGKDYDHGNFSWTDANVSDEQLVWLESHLAASDRPNLVFVHQKLDGEGSLYIKNAEAVCAILEGAGNVAAVFHGHHHAGGLNVIKAIPYLTLKGAIEGAGLENNSFAIIDVLKGGQIRVEGFRREDERVIETPELEV